MAINERGGSRARTGCRRSVLLRTLYGQQPPHRSTGIPRGNARDPGQYTQQGEQCTLWSSFTDPFRSGRTATGVTASTPGRAGWPPVSACYRTGARTCLVLSPTKVQDGFVGYWDCREKSWSRDAVRMLERSNWCVAVLGRSAHDTYRVEFFVVDAPFAIVFRYRRDPCTNRHYRDVSTGEIATEEPVICSLDSLPPEYCR